MEALQRAEQPGRQLQGLLRREGAGPLLEERREAGRLGKGAQDAAALRLLKEQAPRAGEVELLRLCLPREAEEPDLTLPRAGAEPAYQHVVPDASARLRGGPGRDRPPLCGGAEPVLPAAEAKLP